MLSDITSTKFDGVFFHKYYQSTLERVQCSQNQCPCIDLLMYVPSFANAAVRKKRKIQLSIQLYIKIQHEKTNAKEKEGSLRGKEMFSILLYESGKNR